MTAVLNNKTHAFEHCDNLHTAFFTMNATNAFRSMGLKKTLRPLVMMTR